MTRTSSTDPLQIQTVTPAGTPGLIGMTLCPGHKGPSLAVGHWDRDLATDLETIRAWKPDLVITLMQDHEFAVLGVPHFRRDVAASGIPWVFAPIVGLLAATLLVELGADPPRAVAAVKGARPGAIETDAQKAYVLGRHAVPQGSV